MVERESSLSSGLILKVYNPPTVSITEVSGAYDGAANGVSVDLPRAIFQLLMESIL
jgi:hypothetical protein